LLLLSLPPPGKTREVTTIYEVKADKDGAVYAIPDYQFTYSATDKYAGPKTDSCVPKSGFIPDAYVRVNWTSTYKYAPSKWQIFVSVGYF
jgi:hypothetical protein